jgi:hypothetical protein
MTLSCHTENFFCKIVNIEFCFVFEFEFYLVWSTYPAGMTDNKCGINQSINRALWKQLYFCRYVDSWLDIGINRKLARTVSWSTSMATATYGLDVIYEGQQWIVDQIQKVAVRIAKDVAGLKATTAGCDAIFQALTVGLRELQMICGFWETK